MVVQLRKCCCCFGWNVRMCTIVIGVISLLSSAYALRSSLADAFLTAATLMEDHSISRADPDMTLHTVIFAVYITGTILSLVDVILNIILLVGASKNHPGKVKPWIVFCVVQLFLVVLVTIAYVCFVMSLPRETMMRERGIQTLFPIIVGVILHLLIRIYFLWVVNSFHTQLITNFPQNWQQVAPKYEYEDNAYQSVKIREGFV